MVRKDDGTLRRPAPPGATFDVHGVNSGALVIVHDDAIHDVGIGVSSGIDFDPPTQFNYEATLFALDDRLLLRVIVRQDDWEWSRSVRSSDDGGRTWQPVTDAPPLDAWRLVDEVEGYG